MIKSYMEWVVLIQSKALQPYILPWQFLSTAIRTCNDYMTTLLLDVMLHKLRQAIITVVEGIGLMQYTN